MDKLRDKVSEVLTDMEYGDILETLNIDIEDIIENRLNEMTMDELLEVL